MSDVSNTQNLNAHYSSETKVKRPTQIATITQRDLRSKRVFNDREANLKMRAINNDIYSGTQQAKNNDKVTFIKWFGGLVLTILACLGIKRFFR